MVAKVKLSFNRAWFHCPGCDHPHAYRIKASPTPPHEPVWEFNGDVDKPTFSPSLLNTSPEARCHLYVTGGTIKFLDDCHHELAGKIVEMEDV